MASDPDSSGQTLPEVAFNAAPVRLWAAVDLTATAPLLLPATAIWFIGGIHHLAVFLGEPVSLPAFRGLQLFFVCLAGALGLLWSLVRLVWPDPNLSFADTLGRLWVAGLIGVFVAAHGLPSILWLFVLTELLGALHQGSNFVRWRRAGSSRR